MTGKKTILILGAGSDIAKAIARKSGSMGYDIQLAGRHKEQLERLEKDLTGRYSVNVSILFFDAAAFESHVDLITQLPVIPDVVVYSAGIMYEQHEASRTWDKINDMIAVNYAGAISVLNQIAIPLSKRGTGCIIAISSVAGDRGRGSNYIYGSTKAALTTYLSGLRNELFGKGVQVITVKPSFVYTKMTQHLTLPKKLTATPEEVANKVYKAIEKNKNVVYVKPIWRWIMRLIIIIPEPLFKRTKL